MDLINSTSIHLNHNITTFNSSYLKPWSVPMELVVLLSTLYTITTICSIIGNVLVVIVFARGRRSRTDLRPFLVNLAIADLIMAVFCMPFTFADTIFRTWIFSKPMCPVVLFMQILSVSASVLINVAIGIDRFIVVAYPLCSKASQARSKYVIASIWVSSLIIATVVVPIANTKHITTYRIKCQEFWPSDNMKRVYTVALFLLIYVLPLCVLSIAYTCVGFVLWKRTSPGNRDHVRDMLQLRSKIKVVKMLILVVLMFGICWLPLHVFTLVVNFNPDILRYKSPADEKFYLGVYLSVHWLAMSNSFANPLIYGFTNESFRADLRALVQVCFPCCLCQKTGSSRINNNARTQESQTILRHSARRGTFDSSASTRSSRQSFKSTSSFGSIPSPEKKAIGNNLNLRNTLLRKNSTLPDVVQVRCNDISGDRVDNV